MTPEILRGGEVAPRRFDPKSASPFVNKSVSEETRRAYGRALREFFQFAGMKHPAEVVPADIMLWRDRLRAQRKSTATVAFKLSVVRSFFEYLKAARAIPLNPASTKLVSPPELSSGPAGRALSTKEVRYLLSGPDREKPEGARDYALMLVMLRLSLRVSKVCSLRTSSVRWSHGRWTLRCKVKGGREETWPLPKDVKEAIDHYLRLDRKRREISHSGGEDAYLFQPHTNYRTLEFDKPLSTRMVQKIVKRWADYSRLGNLSPHDLRRTACTGRKTSLASVVRMAQELMTSLPSPSQRSHSPAKPNGRSSLMRKKKGCFLPPVRWSSRRATLPPPSPLRTVRESFHLTRLKPP